MELLIFTPKEYSIAILNHKIFWSITTVLILWFRQRKNRRLWIGSIDYDTSKNSDSRDRNALVQGPWSIAGTASVHERSWYMGCRMHFRGVFHQEAIFLGERVWNRADFPNIFNNGHTYREGLARDRKTAWLQRVFPTLEEAKPERLASANIVKRDRTSREDVGT